MELKLNKKQYYIRYTIHINILNSRERKIVQKREVRESNLHLRRCIIEKVRGSDKCSLLYLKIPGKNWSTSWGSVTRL